MTVLTWTEKKDLERLFFGIGVKVLEDILSLDNAAETESELRARYGRTQQCTISLRIMSSKLLFFDLAERFKIVVLMTKMEEIGMPETSLDKEIVTALCSFNKDHNRRLGFTKTRNKKGEVVYHIN